MPFFRTLTISLILLLFITITLYAQRPLPETVYDSVNHRSVFVFSDQLHSGLNDNEARFAATHYVGCQKMPRVDIDRIRQFNENFIHLHYKLAITVDSIADYGMILGGNWFFNNRSPFSNWGQVREHPDWFLTHSGGKWTVHKSRRIVMDITNEGFREWWVSSCIEEMKANGCDGVFADTYTVAAIFGQTDNPLFASVDQTVSDWIPKLNEYGQYVYTRLDSAGFYFFPNIDNLQTTWANNAGTHYSKGDYLHAAMMESWGNWASSSDAFTGIQKAVAIQKKGVFIHGEGYYGGSHDMTEIHPGHLAPDARILRCCTSVRGTGLYERTKGRFQRRRRVRHGRYSPDDPRTGGRCERSVPGFQQRRQAEYRRCGGRTCGACKNDLMILNFSEP